MVIIRNIILLFLLVSNVFVFAQETKDDIEKKAQLYFKNKQYFEATPLYLRLLSLEPRSHDYNYKYGTCLLYNSEEKKIAFRYLNYAVQKPEDIEVEAFYFLAKAYHLTFQFDKAIKNYQLYKDKAGSKIDKTLEVDRQIEMCRNGKALMSNLTEIVILNKTKIDEQSFFRIYDLSDIGGQFLVTAEFQTKADKKNNHTPLIHFPSNSNKIYYSSYGDNGDNKDIYVRNRFSNGDWSKPLPIFGKVNTKYNEDYPYMSPTKNYLYFCSEGHNSMGGYDIFRSKYDEDSNTFGEPENLDIPISSPDNDLLYIVDSLEQFAYFASQRTSENNKVDVYKVRVERIPTQFVILKGEFISEVNPSEKALSITVKNNAGKLMGVYKTTANGEYLINLPKGGRYEFVLNVGSKEQDISQFVDIPYLKEFRPLKQRVKEYFNNEDEVVQVFNLFDENFEDEEAIIAEALELKSKMNVNQNQFDLKELDNAKEQRKFLDEIGLGKYTNLEIHDLIATKNEELQKRQENTKALISETIDEIQQSNERIAHNLRKADSLLKVAENTTDSSLKEKQILIANKANLDAKEMQKIVNDKQQLVNFLSKDLSEYKELTSEAKQVKEELKNITLEDDIALIELLDAHPSFSKDLKVNTRQNAAFEFQEQKEKQLVTIKSLKENKAGIIAEADSVKENIENLKKDLAQSKKKQAEAIQSEIYKEENRLYDLNNEISYIDTQIDQIEEQSKITESTETSNSIEQTVKKDIAQLIEQQNTIENTIKKLADENQVVLTRNPIEIEEWIAEAEEEKKASEQGIGKESGKQEEQIKETEQNSENDAAETETELVNFTETPIKETPTKESPKEKVEETGKVKEDEKQEKLVSEVVNEEKLDENEEINEDNSFRINFYEILTAEEKVNELEEKKKELLNQISKDKKLQKDTKVQQSLINIEQEITKQRSNHLEKKLDNELPTLAELTPSGNQTTHSLNVYADKVLLDESIQTLESETGIDTIRKELQRLENSINKIEEDLVLDKRLYEVNNHIRSELNSNDYDLLTLLNEIKSKSSLVEEQKNIEEKLKQLRNSVLKLEATFPTIDDQEEEVKVTNKIRKINIIIEELEFIYAENQALINQIKIDESNYLAKENTYDKKSYNVPKTEEKEISSTANYAEIYKESKELKQKQETLKKVNENIEKEKQTIEETSTKNTSSLTTVEKQAISGHIREMNKLMNEAEELKQEITLIKEQIKTKTDAQPSEQQAYINQMIAKDIQPKVSVTEEELTPKMEYEVETETEEPLIAETTEKESTPEIENEVETKREEPIVAETTEKESTTKVESEVTETKENVAENTTEEINQEDFYTLNNESPMFEAASLQEKKALQKLYEEKELLNTLTQTNPKLSEQKAHQNKVLQVNEKFINQEGKILENSLEELRKLTENNANNSEDKNTSTLLKAKQTEIKIAELKRKAEKEKDNKKKLEITDEIIELQREQIVEVTIGVDAEKNKQFLQEVIAEQQLATKDVNEFTTTESNRVEEQQNIQVQLLTIEDEIKSLRSEAEKAKKKDKKPIQNNIEGLEIVRKELIDLNKEKQAQLLAIQQEKEADKNKGVPESAIEHTLSFKEEVDVAKSVEYKDLFSLTNQLHQKQHELEAKNTALTKEKEQIKTLTSAISNSESPRTEEKKNIVNHIQKADGLNKDIKTLREEIKVLQQQVQSGIAQKPTEKKAIENLLVRDVVPITEVITIQTIETGISLTGSEGTYSNDNPIPIKKEVVKGLVFRVQIGAFSKPVPNNTFKEFHPISGDPVRPGLIRYVAGLFNTRSTAEQARDQIRNMGYRDAFVVAYCDGERVPVWRAMELMNSGACVPQIDVKENELFAKASSAPGSGGSYDPDGELDLFSYNQAPNAAKAEATEAILGLYYTVQVGVYNRPVSAQQLFNISPLVTKRLPNGQIRYSTGIFNSVAEAQPKRADAIQRGVKDAFITAYYQGNRITLAEADAILKLQGESVLELNNPTKVKGNKIVNKEVNEQIIEIQKPYLEGKTTQIVLSSETIYYSYPTQVLNRLNDEELNFYFDSISRTIKSVLMTVEKAKKYNYSNEFKTEEYFNHVYLVQDKAKTKKSEAISDSEETSIHLSIEIEEFDMNSDLLEVIMNVPFNKEIKIDENRFMIELYALNNEKNNREIDQLKALLSKLGASVIAKYN